MVTCHAVLLHLLYRNVKDIQKTGVCKRDGNDDSGVDNTALNVLFSNIKDIKLRIAKAILHKGFTVEGDNNQL